MYIYLLPFYIPIVFEYILCLSGKICVIPKSQLNILQEIHQDYNGAGKSVDSNDPISPYQLPRGYGGVAILWRKDLDSYITPLQGDSIPSNIFSLKSPPIMI
jgi:hypothetical protein